MEDGSDSYLVYPDIWVESMHLYSVDGVQMSNKGNELFPRDIQQGMPAALCCPWGTRLDLKSGCVAGRGKEMEWVSTLSLIPVWEHGFH